MDPLAAREFRLQMQSALLRTIAAVLRAGAEPPDAAHVATELEDVDRAIAALPRAGRPMLDLAHRWGWGPLETDFLWVTLALAVEPRLLVHARALDPSAAQGMSTALYSRIARLDAESSIAISRTMNAERPLPRSGLLAAAPGTWLPTSTPWSPAAELLPYLLGEEHERLPLGVTQVQLPTRIIVDGDQDAAIDVMRSTLARQTLVIVHGPEGSGRRTAIAQATDGPVLALDLTRIDIAALDQTLVGLLREASLRDAVAVIAGIEDLQGDGAEGRLRMLAQHIDRSDVPIALITTREDVDVRSARPAIRIQWMVPDVRSRTELWREIAGAHDATDHAILAQRFQIGAGGIIRATNSARVVAKKDAGAPLTTAELVVGVRHNTAERMAGLAERVIIKQTWDDCVLPEDVHTQVTALIGRAEQAHVVFEQWGYRSKMARGTGVAAMFSGPPGTGKTMVAGLIANQLGRELYQVDLSKVVSKWIGETEKQLGKLFDAAEDGHAVLLFDEADSMFGKRSSEMKSATDRYANLEVNFLLQRVESFHGIVILTTNLDASIDPAFKRRLAAHVVFQHPEEQERALLWKRMITSDGAPLARDIDTRSLARLFPKMTGANIRNAALGAAFLAAAQRRSVIDQGSLVAAARSEYLSMGHVLTTGTL